MKSFCRYYRYGTVRSTFCLVNTRVYICCADLAELQEYAKKERSLESVYDRIGDLFEGHPDLQAEFVNFLPKKMQTKMNNGSRVGVNRTGTSAQQQGDTRVHKLQGEPTDEHNKAATSNTAEDATSADGPLDTLSVPCPPDGSVVEPRPNSRPEPARHETAPVRPCEKISDTSSTASANATSAAGDGGNASRATKRIDDSAGERTDDGDVSATEHTDTGSNGGSINKDDDPGSNDDSTAERKRTSSEDDSPAEHNESDHASPIRPAENSWKRLKTEPSSCRNE